MEAKNHLQHIVSRILSDKMESEYDIKELIDQEVEFFAGRDYYPLVKEAGNPKNLRKLISEAVDENLRRRG